MDDFLRLRYDAVHLTSRYAAGSTSAPGAVTEFQTLCGQAAQGDGDALLDERLTEAGRLEGPANKVTESGTGPEAEEPPGW
jgi:hypothetical protein